MPPMRGVAERAEVGIVRSGDEDASAIPQQAMELLHGTDHVGHVLDNVDGPDFVEGVIAERVRKVVEIAKDVGARSGNAVDADRAGIFVNPTPNVENSRLQRRGRAFRHPSSVSTAKSA